MQALTSTRILFVISVAKLTNSLPSVGRDITVNQYDTVRLDCYSHYDESADWYFHDNHGDTDPIYSSGYLQPQGKAKYSVSAESGFYNLTIVNVSLQDSGRYECREGWGVGGRPRHNFELRVKDIDECLAWNNICDVNANCTNTPGSFYCSCNSGFIGDGFKCEDENECLSSPCGANANCTNIPGSHVCACYTGHINLQLEGGCTMIQEVHVSAGESRQLQCQTFPNAPIVWLYVANDTSRGIHLYHDNKIVDPSKNILEHLMKPSDGDYSLTLNEVTVSETGYYVCVNEKDGTKRGYFLDVTDAAAALKIGRSTSVTGAFNGLQKQNIPGISTELVIGLSVVAAVVIFVLVGAILRVALNRRWRNSSTRAIDGFPALDGNKEHDGDASSRLLISSVTHSIAPGECRKGHVAGLTVHGNELFVVRYEPKGLVEVYNSTTLTFTRSIEVKEVDDGNSNSYVYGLTSCDTNNCLYVSYLFTDGGCIVRVELTADKKVVKWKVKDLVLDNIEPHGLSVNGERNLMVACRWPHKLIEYTTRGEFVREILLPNIKWPQQGIQLNSSQFLVSHGGFDSLQRVCIVDANGQILLSYGNKLGSETGQLKEPRHLAVSNGLVYVADKDNNRIVVLDSTLKWSRDLNNVLGVKKPYSLYLDERHKLLFVGEWNGENSRVVVVSV